MHVCMLVGSRLLASTRGKFEMESCLDTFVYAVPRHVLEPGLPYNPYDVTTITHEALFGESESVNQVQDARWDYYTISRAGFAFHAKCDDFRSTFLSAADWESEKAQFSKLRSLSTFSWYRIRHRFVLSSCGFVADGLLRAISGPLSFRYRKVFIAWKHWIRAGKREAARENLLAGSYFSHPVLFEGMQEVRAELAQLSGLRLLWHFDGATASLAHFTATNTRELQKTTARIQNILAKVCRRFLDDKAPVNGGFPGHEFAISARKSSNFHIFENFVQREQGLVSAYQQLVQHEHFKSTAKAATSQSAQSRAAQLRTNLPARLQRMMKNAHHHSAAPRDELDEIRWTLAAIRRSKCRQLRKFALLVDFLLLEAFARVVKRSLVLLHHLLLRGANAANVLHLIARGDLASAMYKTLMTVAKSSLQAGSEGSTDSSALSQARPARQPQPRVALTRQQIKGFLRTAWDGKLAASGASSSEPEAATASFVWMESKLQALFFQSLSDHVGEQSDVYSVDDLLFVAENALGQLLVLPPFCVANDSAYITDKTPAVAESEVTAYSVDEEVLAIPCLRPVPLFRLVLRVANSREGRRRGYQINVEPELEEVVNVLQSTIRGFTEAFREVPPLLSSPELRGILDFADDIRALTIEVTANEDEGGDSRAQGEENDDEERCRSPADRLSHRMEDDVRYRFVREEIEDLAGSALHGSTAFTACYSEFLELRKQNDSVKFAQKARQFRQNEYSLQEMLADASHFNHQIGALQALKMAESVEFLHFDMRKLQTELLPSPTRCLDAMRELLPLLAREKCDQFLEYVNVSSKKIRKPVVQDLDAFTTYLLSLRDVYDEVLDKECDLAFLHEFFRVLEKLQFTASVETMRAFELCEPEFHALKAQVQEAHASRDSDLGSYAPMLTAELAQVPEAPAVKLQQEAELMQQKATRFVRIQQVFEESSTDSRPPSNTFERLNVLAAELKLKSLWTAVCEADEYLSACSIESLRSIDLAKMGVLASRVDSVVDRIRQRVSQVAGDFEVERLERLQATLHGLAPMIRDLRNPHLAERHWSKLERKMQCSLTPPSSESTEAEDASRLNHPETSSHLDLTVQHLLSVNAVAHTTTARHVSEEATAEAAIADSFQSIARTWEVKELPVGIKKDRDGRDVTFIGDCIALTSLVEESQVLLRVMDASTYTRVVQERLPKLLGELELTKESLELLQICQRKWDQTQRLVSADFARSFPDQAKQLQKHDNAWRALTSALSKRPLCLPFGVNAEQRAAMRGLLAGFELAAKGLADHLALKRQVFPVFFQLSDLELSTLLSKARDVSAIQPFLFQCFDNVGRIVFGARDSFQDILQVHSLLTTDGSASFPLFWGHSKTILLADRIVRCEIIETGIQEAADNGVTGISHPLEQVRCRLIAYSACMTNGLLPHQPSRSPSQPPLLSPRQFALLSGLCLQEIHFRDALAGHLHSQHQRSAASSPPGSVAIDWELQLKYRLDDLTTVGHECHVQMNTLSVPYGFNYVSPATDIVVAPGSLRSLFALSACIRHAQGCVLTGDSESGKHTLSTQVSSMLGRRSFTAVLTSYTHASRLLIGALYAGGTFCARVGTQPISTATTALIKTLMAALTAIEHAVLTKNPISDLHRSPITFAPGTAMLLVLPWSTRVSTRDAEELRIWTEPLCRFVIIQWDWSYLIEALLHSQGLDASPSLAKQLLSVWHQVRASWEASNQALSSAKQNPFAFSSLKAIIATVGCQQATSIPPSGPKPSEKSSHFHQTLICRAMLQYFVDRIDSEHFKTLERALEASFPFDAHDLNNYLIPREPMTIKHVERSAKADTSLNLHECLKDAAQGLRFVPRPALLASASSLAAALTFNSSVVLLGPSGVGKTTAYQVLAKALGLYWQRQEQVEAAASLTARSETEQVRPRPPPLSKRSSSTLLRVLSTASSTDPRPQDSVAVRVVLPMALTVTQLYGGVTVDGQGRIPCILGRLLHEAQELHIPQATSCGIASDDVDALFGLRSQLWVVCDGALDLRWVETLLVLLSKPSHVTAPLLAFEDGEFMTRPPNLRFLFETLQLHDATPSFLHLNAILPFQGDESIEGEAKPMATPVDQSRMDVATAYLHRYLLLQREQASVLQTEMSSSQGSDWSPAKTFDVVERWLVKKSLLAELAALIDANSDGSVDLPPLQRVTSLTTLLQSLLSSASALPDSHIAVSGKTIAAAEASKELPIAHIRVELALIYSVLWGFAACTSDRLPLQRQLSDVLRRAFEHLSASWAACAPSGNLFETLLDLRGLQFVPVSCGSTQLATFPIVSSSLSSLFVPTTSSLVTHAALKEALRSGRGVLLLGDASARRTTLLRNFLAQLPTLRSIIAAGGVASSSTLPHSRHPESEKPDKETDVATDQTAATLASVKRFRFRQISLITLLSARFQKDQLNRDQTTTQDAQGAGLDANAGSRFLSDADAEEDSLTPAIAPSLDLQKTAMVRQFDQGDVIPFFFAMPSGTSSDGSEGDEAASALASCLERMLQRERTGVFEPPPGKTALLLLDDLHLPIQHDRNSPRPSVHAYLRSLSEHGSVYHGANCAPIAVENLMLLASMQIERFPASTREEPLRKLMTRFFPVLAPSCSLKELHHIFGQALQAQWAAASGSTKGGCLTPAVRHTLPLMIAATTVLWDRLREAFRFKLQDLARVYEGLAGVAPSPPAVVEMLLRLWTHECSRTLREPVMGISTPSQDDQVAVEIARMRSLLSQGVQRRASARASRLTLSGIGVGGVGSVSGAVKRTSIATEAPAIDEEMNTTACLALFATRSSSSWPVPSSQQRGTHQELQHSTVVRGGLWAFVPTSLYYSNDVGLEGGATATATTLVNNNGEDPAASRRLRPGGRTTGTRRESLELALKGSSITNGLSGEGGNSGRRIYAELSFEDDSEAVATAAVQPCFGSLRTFSTSLSGLHRVATLPRDVPPVPFALVNALLHFVDASRRLEPPRKGADDAILALSGLPNDAGITNAASRCVAVRWTHLLCQIYERVGVVGQEATLIVKRLDLLPPAIVSQLQTLMTTGEVPGALSLGQQVQLATRVCDERLLVLQTKHAALVAQIRRDAELVRDQAAAELQQQQRDSVVGPPPEAFQLVEARYQRDLRSKLARAELRWQQDSDDLRRAREVESESVAATVMALTRPLGVTSGKWASAVARIRSKLRVVLLIDRQHEAQVRAANPNVFSTCDVVSVPQLNRESLRTLVYGHFHAQVQQLQATGGGTGGLTEFLLRVERELWTVACMAADMHLAVVESIPIGDEDARPPTSRAFVMASSFSKLLVDGYKREEAAQTKASWFLNLSDRLERDLATLRGSDSVLNDQLTVVKQQIESQGAHLEEQKQDAERIRAIMLRFQTAAEEQVQVTNEAQEVAQGELRDPMACLEEASRALLLVDKRHIVEIKSFVSPPPLVHLVLGAVCVLFQIEPSWESARRLLLGDANVVQTLLQFDKDAVPSATLSRLGAEFLGDERFCHEEVERQSVAAASMVGWVRAIHQYASARRQVQPTLDRLEKAQTRLQLIMKEFQVSKQRVVEADEAWEATQATLEATKSRKQALTSELMSLEARCQSGGLAIEELKDDRQRQQETVNACAMRRGFALTSWNALLSAGTLAYACELGNSERRHRIFQAWEAAYDCYGGLTPGCPPTSTRCTFVPSIRVVLKEVNPVVEARETPLTSLFAGDYPSDSEAEETLKLVTGVAGLCFSQRRLWDATLLSLVASTPALPVVMITRYSCEFEELLVTCARRVWHWSHLLMVHAQAADFDEVFHLAVREGHQLLVLDVEPLDAEPRAEGASGKCLSAAFRFETSRVNDMDHLIVPCSVSTAVPQATEESGESCTETLVLHSNFRLILTSHASRSAFGEALELLPTLDAQLQTSDVAGVVLDKVWSSSRKHSSGEANATNDISGFPLKAALREHLRLAKQFIGSQNQLTKLMEAAAVTEQFPLTQTQSLRQRLAATQAARRELKEKRLEIQEQLRRIQSQATPLARAGAAVFTAFNATMREDGAKTSPPLTLQTFLPMFFEALTPPSASPVLPKDPKRQPSGRRLGMLTASSRGPSGFFGPTTSELLTNLLAKMTPLIPPASSHEDWNRFLLQTVLALEELQPVAQKLPSMAVTKNEEEAVQAPSEDTRLKPRSVATILLQAKLAVGSRGHLELLSIDRDSCLAVKHSAELQQRVVHMIVHGYETDRGASEAGGAFSAILRSVLIGASSRSERIRIGLSLFPQLVRSVCDRVLAVYGVMHSESEHANQKVGPWLRVMQTLPEQTAVLVLSRHGFNSFVFVRRVFFQALAGSPTLQLRVLQQLSDRSFQNVTEGSTALHQPSVPLSQLYVLPRLVYPPEEEHHEEAQQLLLMASGFEEIAQLEKTQLEVLEAAPLAVINMQREAARFEHWEALFQILYRSCQHTTSTAFKRLNSVILGVSSRGLAKPLSATTTPTSLLQARVSLGRSSTFRRTSTSQSMGQRLSEIELMTPTYPRLLATVNDWHELPIHLRQDVLCFRDEDEDGDSGQIPFKKCLQSTILRLVLYPIAAKLTMLVQLLEDDKTALSDSRSTELWLLLSGLVLFHATLTFRTRALRAAYPGVFPEALQSTGTSVAFLYGDDAFLTAVSQVLASMADRQQQQRRCTVRSAARREVMERKLHQQVALTAYTRLAAGRQEVEMLRRLFTECLQLVGWHLPPLANDHGVNSDMLRSRGRNRQMTVREQLQGTASSTTQETPQRSLSVMGRSSVLASSVSPLLLGFLGFPTESLHRIVASFSQWLELMWGYTASLDRQADAKLQTLLLGFNHVHRGPPVRGSSRGLLAVPSSVEMPGYAPPTWTRAFGWVSEHNTALLGDAAELAASTPLRDAIAVLRAILTEALPQHFELGACEQEEGPAHSDEEQEEEHSEWERLASENGKVEEAQRTMVDVYNVQVDAYCRGLDTLLNRLMTYGEAEAGDPHNTNSLLEPSDGGDGKEEEDSSSEEQDQEEQPNVMLSYVADDQVRQQIVAILRNEVPPDLLPRDSPPIASSWSLHDVLQHYQDWSSFLSIRTPHHDSGLVRWWLPGLLACGLPVTHVLELAKAQYCEGHPDFHEHSAVQFTLRLSLESSADKFKELQDIKAISSAAFDSSNSTLLEHSFAVFEGVIILGASWDEEAQCITRASDQRTYQRVELACSLSPADSPQEDGGGIASMQQPHSRKTQSIGRLQSVPLVASQDGAVLLECPLAVASSGLNPLATPLLISIGSHCR
ncbi:hypothetical protein BBJ28_00006653 [Nothophytophthora sp. Chile5]|nr:hypothetical protein BBJ28_00006653 [Nothophytophthora sp. Chile5]